MEKILKRIMYVLAAYGLNQAMGIPIIGNVVATLLQGASNGLEAAADYVRYQSIEEANTDAHTRQSYGAQVTKLVQYQETGEVGVTYQVDSFDAEGYYAALGEVDVVV